MRRSFGSDETTEGCSFQAQKCDCEYRDRETHPSPRSSPPTGSHRQAKLVNRHPTQSSQISSLREAQQAGQAGESCKEDKQGGLGRQGEIDRQDGSEKKGKQVEADTEFAETPRVGGVLC
eukprot:GHVN01027265.1.p3 GENE.GHVN01027265.1~~GHVN01027265.1.p3  ORF type:complete len:120 (+),score=23.47 GHVN01027265.1:1207-1566(+)